MAPYDLCLLYSCTILSPCMRARPSDLLLTTRTWKVMRYHFQYQMTNLWFLSCSSSISIAFSACILWLSKLPCWRGACDEKLLNPVSNEVSKLRSRAIPRRWLQSQLTPWWQSGRRLKVEDPGKPCLHSWPVETVNKCCFKSLSFGVISHIAIDN